MTTDRTDHIDAMLQQISAERRAVADGDGEPGRLQLLVRELVDLFTGNHAEVSARMGVTEDELHTMLQG